MPTRWTHPSVVALAGDADPVEAVTARARDVVLAALDAGWSGPPFDPIRLADLLGLEVAGNAAVRDARAVPVGGNRVRIEFNPNRPRGRVRYSLAHEIAHTLFPDCAEQVRHRGRHDGLAGDAWQLEALCNIAAAEFLMPLGSFAPRAAEVADIRAVLDLQRHFDVSTEALVIRLAETSAAPLAAFCASPRAGGADAGGLPDTGIDYRLDYVIPSRAWAAGPAAGRRAAARTAASLPTDSVVRQCTAIGYSAAGVETWPTPDESGPGAPVRVEAVGIPPYPGAAAPRVVGLLRPMEEGATVGPGIEYVFGSATEPRGSGPRLVVQVVNDRTPNWGGAGFASAVRTKWPGVQEDFRDWAEHHHGSYRLGAVRVSRVDAGLGVANVVAQHGYGPSPTPRLRYAALRDGLRRVAREAREAGASVHMPRIGVGHAGGAWSVVEDLIRDTLVDAGVAVTVYDLPGTAAPREAQPSFAFR